jgi:hypothetical protein
MAIFGCQNRKIGRNIYHIYVENWETLTMDLKKNRARRSGFIDVYVGTHL